jgi:UDP-3-O-[3-hydroxymyristoyl] glucosamine N-acyltransferase
MDYFDVPVGTGISVGVAVGNGGYVGPGVWVGLGVAVGFGVLVGLGVAVGFGVLVGLSVAVGFGVLEGLSVAGKGVDLITVPSIVASEDEGNAVERGVSVVINGVSSEAAVVSGPCINNNTVATSANVPNIKLPIMTYAQIWRRSPGRGDDNAAGSSYVS